MKLSQLNQIIKEEVQKELNESAEVMNATSIILPALGVLAGIPLGVLAGKAFLHDEPIIQQIKDWWQSKQDNKAMNKIANRIKDDPEVVAFLKNPNKRGWQKMLASKLTDDEQQYVRSIYKNRIKSIKPND